MLAASMRLLRLVALLLALLVPAVAVAGSVLPRYQVESVEVRGHRKTVEAVIRRQLQIRPGDTIAVGDPRVELARLRVLALGLFADVQVRLQRGSARGQVVLLVEVSERGTLTLHQLFLGTSEAVPLWGGLDVAEQNLGGRGIVLGGAFVVATAGEVAQSRPQHALRLRLAVPRLAQTPFSLSAVALYNQASEPYRLTGGDDDGRPGHFQAVSYRRVGGVLGFGADLGAFVRLGADYRVELVSADLPESLVRVRPDGRGERVAIGLRPGESWNAILSLCFERDTRSDPVLPTDGSRLIVQTDLAFRPLGSSYEFYKLTVHYQGWFKLPWGHVLSPIVSLGAMFGEAPIFERFYIGDWNPLLPQRALGLTLSTHPSRNLLGLGIAGIRYGDVAARIGWEYVWPLWRGGRYFYGGQLFAGFGAMALARGDDLLLRDRRDLAAAVPVDLWFDSGLRLDTYIGIFNFSIANVLGRAPL